MHPAEQNSSFWHLVQALRNKQVVAFVGAGVSQAVLAIPTWNDFISGLLIKVKQKTKPMNPDFIELVDCLTQRVAEGKEDLLFAAEQCRKYLLDEFDESIRERLKPKTIKDQNAKKGLEVLLGLPFYRIITTNYDNLLLDVARDSQPDKVTDYFTHMDSGYFADFLRHADSPERRLIFHLHGHMNRPESVILSESQYQKLYAAREVTDLLEAIFTSKSALFIGFGLADEDIMQNFRRILAKFRPVREQHFAIFPRDPQDSTPYSTWLKTTWLRTLRYNYRYGIGLIYYQREGKCHDRLWEVVGALNREVNNQEGIKPEKEKEKPQRCLAIAMDEGFPYSRNLWEIISFLNEAQDQIKYELVGNLLKVNLPDKFIGTLSKKDPGFRDDFRGAIDFLDNNKNFDGILVFTAKRESSQFFFCDRGWGGFVSTWFWDDYVLKSKKKETQSKAMLYFQRPSIDDYLWHTTVILTVHFYDQNIHGKGNKMLITHKPPKPDAGCIFDFTKDLEDRLKTMEYPRLCRGCADILEEIFATQDIKLNAAWLRRVIPLAE
jgi:hypothetical protein